VETIENQLLEQLGQKFGGRPALSDSLILIGVDSVGMAELTFDIEKNYGIRVDDEVLEVDTVQDLANYIRNRQSKLTKLA
jgi:acyl carrier protein